MHILFHVSPISLLLYNLCLINFQLKLFPFVETGVEYSRMITDFEEWAEDNPAPASIMIISNELALRKSHSSRLCRKLQESNYNCFLAYSVRPFEMPVLVTSAEWLWDNLLAGLFVLYSYITTKLITLSFFFFLPSFRDKKKHSSQVQ